MAIVILVMVWGAFVIVAAAIATGVALFQPDQGRRKDAVQVLRTVLGAGTAAAVFTAALIRLHEVGLV